ncbi:MAG: PqiC family protein [Opitutaceae bacterium]
MNKIIMNFLSAIFVLVACLAVNGCVNLKPKADVVKLYALGPVEVTAPTASNGPSVFVARPDMPAFLDGKRLQFRSENGEVEELSRARWAEPLQEGVARALAEYLQQQGVHDVSGFYPWPKKRDDLELHVHLFKLGALESGEIRMSADWEFRKAGKVQRSGSFQSQGLTWQVGDPDSFVAGINQALDQLAHAVGKG